MEMLLDGRFINDGQVEIKQVGLNLADVAYYTETGNTIITMVVLKTDQTLFIVMRLLEFHQMMRMAGQRGRDFYLKN